MEEIAKFGLNVIDGGLSGYVDTSGSEIAPLGYTFATSFHAGYAIAGKNGKYERLHYDANEKKITSEPFDYDKVEFFSNSHVIVVKKGLYGLVDISSGKEIFRPIYRDITLNSYYGRAAAVILKDTGRAFYINQKGECVADCENKK